MNEKVLGIDVGYAITGWSIVEKDSRIANKFKLRGYGAVTTKPKLADETRLKLIYDGLLDVVEKYKPTVMAVESLFYFKNQKTVIKVAQARGAILLVGANAGLEVFDYTPLQVKTSVTGYGRADKVQIQKMVKLLYKLKEVPKPDDIADAIAVGTCHLQTNRIIS